MLATLLDNVAKAATLRETSIVFATIIGIAVFKEPIKTKAMVLIGLIVLGALLVKIG